MSNNRVTDQESYPMNGGDGAYNDAKTSYLQRSVTSIADSRIYDVIMEKLDVKTLYFTSKTLRLADLGFSVEANTFTAMQNILEAIHHKYQTQNLAGSELPEFQVLFNDHASNDFNTLFASLPPERKYFVAGVPGSFYRQIFPESSLHFVHSFYAMHWLSKVPDDVVDEKSPAWNKGKIHYPNAPEEVGNAYEAQFATDMKMFLNARAKEIVVGGMMVIIMPSIPDGMSNSQAPGGVMSDLLGSCLMDMAKEGIVSESLVDSFNLPIYAAPLKQMKELVIRNGCFSIEKMETTNPLSAGNNVQLATLVMRLRARMKGIISNHFGNEIIDELFDRLNRKVEENSQLLIASYSTVTKLFVALTRK